MDKQAIFDYNVAPKQQNTSVSDTTAEQMAVSNYDTLYSRVSRRIEHAEGDSKEEEVVTREIDAICKELANLVKENEIKEDKKEFRALRILLSKFKKHKKRFPEARKKIDQEQQIVDEQNAPPPLPPPLITPVHQMASNMEMVRRASQRIDDKDLRKAVTEDYIKCICKCLNKRHQLTFTTDKDTITFSDETSKPILVVGINDQCMVDEVAPVGELASECPFHSSLFYQRYYKPIIEAVGHYYLDGKDSLVVIGKSILPDLPSKEQLHDVDVLSIKEKRPSKIGLSFQDDTWDWTERSARVATAQINEPLSEKDFFNKRVKCIDPAQETIFGKIGDVEQIIPRPDYIELDVNFGRHIVRVTDRQVEIIYGI